jgi:nucleotide-binding universal stress UspA family protein
VLSEVLAAAEEADLLVLGKAGWSLLRRRRLGSTVRGILPDRFGLALVMKEGASLAMPLAVVYDGSAVAGRALVAAAALWRRLEGEQPLFVLLLDEQGRRARELQEQAAGRLEVHAVPARFRTLRHASVLQLVDALESEMCGALVLPARSAALQSNAMVSLLENLEVPALLVT